MAKISEQHTLLVQVKLKLATDTRAAVLHQEDPYPLDPPALPDRQSTPPAIHEEAWQAACQTPFPLMDDLRPAMLLWPSSNQPVQTGYSSVHPACNQVTLLAGKPMRKSSGVPSSVVRESPVRC